MSLFKPFFSRASGPDTRSTPVRRGGRFRAVQVRCASSACAAARRVQRKRFLAVEAPRLPLASCDRPGRCTCSYRHLDDRRQGPRRASELGLLASAQMNGAEQRQRQGRRADDLADINAIAIPDSLEDSYYDYVNGQSG